MAIKEKNGNTFPHELFKVGDLVTFQWDDTLKEGIVLVVDAYGTFESPNIPSIHQNEFCPFFRIIFKDFYG